MKFDISSTPQAVDFDPVDELTEIMQNVRTILNTPQFSVPLDRDFGTDASILDNPIPVARAKYSSLVITAIETYEPRVKVTQISFEEDQLAGKLIKKVRVKLV